MSISINAYIWIVIIFVPSKVTTSASVTQESKPTTSVQMVARYKARNRHQTINVISNEIIDKANNFIFGGNDLSNELFPNSHVTNTGRRNLSTHFVSTTTYRAEVFITFEEIYRSSFERDMIKLKFVGIKIADKTNMKTQEFERTSMKLI